MTVPPVVLTPVVHVCLCCQLKNRPLASGGFLPWGALLVPCSTININLFCLSVFGSVEYEMLRTIKFLQQLDFLLEVVLGILDNIRIGIN